MKTSNRRDFLKKAALAGASALVAPGLLATEEKEVISFSSSPGGETDKFIIPKNNGLIFLIRIGVKESGSRIFAT